MLAIHSTRQNTDTRRRTVMETSRAFNPRRLTGLDLWLRADRMVDTGGARQFTAANSEYFAKADNADLSTGNIDFTLAAWVYLDAKVANRTIFGKYETTGNQREFVLRYDITADKFHFIVSSNGSATFAKSATTLGSPSTGTWYFVVAEHDAANDTLSIQVNNGTIDSAAYSSGVNDGTGPFHLGALDISAAPNYMDGRLARAGFWKRTLTTAERTSLYNAGAGLLHSELSAALKTSLVSYWNLNEPSGNALDAHGSNDLTDTNTVTNAAGPGEGRAVDGDPVSTWTDISSNTKAFSQATIAKRPTFQTNVLSGKPVVRFDGVDDLLVLAEKYLTSAQGTVFAVIQLTAALQNKQVVLGTGDEAAGNVAHDLRGFHKTTEPNISLRLDDNVAANTLRGDTALVAGTTYIQTWSSTGAAYGMRINGAAESLTLLGGADNGNWYADVAALDNVTIGGRKRDIESDFLKGDLAELIVYDRVLTAPETARVERYLANRYGVTLA